uniref:Uncharacterized protein n=1 Tax=uncultured prokaryote TaxID=198431 RepID=A0A0H5Q4Q1_9ZZZZ|nr:hypothetical protein [uncultured prokaryote]
METKPVQAADIADFIVRANSPKASAIRKAISYHGPVELLLKVDALAKQAKTSRNEMITLLIGSGLNAVEAQLPEEVRDQVSMTLLRSLSTIEDDLRNGEAEQC